MGDKKTPKTLPDDDLDTVQGGRHGAGNPMAPGKADGILFFDEADSLFGKAKSDGFIGETEKNLGAKRSSGES